jgi:hypothetical protein
LEKQQSKKNKTLIKVGGWTPKIAIRFIVYSFKVYEAKLDKLLQSKNLNRYSW